MVTEALFIGEIRRRDLAEDHSTPLDRVSEIRFSIKTRHIEAEAKVEDAAKTPAAGTKITLREVDKTVDAAAPNADAKAAADEADDEHDEKEDREDIAEEDAEEETNDA